MSAPNLYAGTKNVKVLTEKDFDLSKGEAKLKTKGKCGYFMVYAHWCPHCISKVPNWTYFADAMKQHKIFTICVAEESTIPNVTAKLGVQGYPSFFEIMEDGSLKRYESQFSLTELMGGLCKNQQKFCGLDKKLCEKNKDFC
jgi:thiol-disulfide isomerase/thioredoxin